MESGSPVKGDQWGMQSTWKVGNAGFSWNNTVMLCGSGLQSPRSACSEAKGTVISHGSLLLSLRRACVCVCVCVCVCARARARAYSYVLVSAPGPYEMRHK